MDGYKTIIKTPEFHFDDGWTGTFELTEESRKALDDLMKEHDAEAERFFDVFENDLICCLTHVCAQCHLNDKKWCKIILMDNARRMIDNQKRMMIEFNRRRNEDAR